MNKIVIYQTSDDLTQIDVKFENEIVWLAQEQMAEYRQPPPEKLRWQKLLERTIRHHTRHLQQRKSNISSGVNLKP